MNKLFFVVPEEGADSSLARFVSASDENHARKLWEDKLEQDASVPTLIYLIDHDAHSHGVIGWNTAQCELQ